MHWWRFFNDFLLAGLFSSLVVLVARCSIGWWKILCFERHQKRSIQWVEGKTPGRPFYEPVFGWICFHSFVRLFIMKKNTICLYIFLYFHPYLQETIQFWGLNFSWQKAATNKLDSPHQPWLRMIFFQPSSILVARITWGWFALLSWLEPGVTDFKGCASGS